MIVVAIIAILAAIAVPQYKAYVMKARNKKAIAQVQLARNAEASVQEQIDCLWYYFQWNLNRYWWR
ncbi:hypothetical protein DMNBHIDG_00159 [Candidatus Methanoperedenaceae archaeon GB37]|nr:hypothetical protein DMNBHIDG_00159 [Candidatus Methanoperedenaceae archaeon GB37]